MDFEYIKLNLKLFYYKIKKYLRVPKIIIRDLRYPFLRHRYLYPLSDWQEWVPKGWWKMSMQMWKEVKDELKKHPKEKICIIDYKEKYGRLDVDCAAPREIHKILEKYEYISERTCYSCGSPAKYMTNIRSYALPYCEKCMDKDKIDTASEYYKDVDWYGYKQF